MVCRTRDDTERFQLTGQNRIDIEARFTRVVNDNPRRHGLGATVLRVIGDLHFS
jgi:hypothetical protein